MPKPHGTPVHLSHTFMEAYLWLQGNGPKALTTEAGSLFEARAATARDGRDVIKFFQEKEQKKKEYGRAYKCCGSGSQNCYGTWIGMYCKELDKEVGRV